MKTKIAIILQLWIGFLLVGTFAVDQAWAFYIINAHSGKCLDAAG